MSFALTPYRKEDTVANDAVAFPRPAVHTKLNRQQITGFWGAWAGWTLDGMDSVIYALVLSPALNELLPKSGIKATPASVGFAGSTLFALFLVGWGLSLIWGPIADKFGRTRVLAATIFVYAIFTGAAAMSQTVWQLGLFRLLAGIGIGGEWALAGTYVAEAWPEDRRKMGAGYLQTGYYAGFFLASALNFTVGARFGWRAMFWCGLTPVVVAFLILSRVKEPERWQQKAKAKAAGGFSSLRRIFRPPYTQRTVVNTVLLAAAICGLWAGAVYAPTAIITLAKRAGMLQPEAVRTASFGMGIAVAGNHPRLPCCSTAGGTLRPEADSCLLLCRDGDLYRAEFRLGFLSAAGTPSVHRRAVLSGLLWRQLRGLQSLVAGTVWNDGARDGFCVHHFVWALLCRGRELRGRRSGQRNGNSRQAGCVHSHRLWDRAAGNPLWRRNPRESAARLSSERVP